MIVLLYNPRQVFGRANKSEVLEAFGPWSNNGRRNRVSAVCSIESQRCAL